MQLAYYADEPHAPAWLQRYLQAWGVTLRPYTLGEQVAEEGLVLFGPQWCNGRFVDGAANWWRYFQKKGQDDLKLLTASLETAPHPNHLCLLDLPTDWPAFWATAQPCKTPWPHQPNADTDLNDLLRVFYLGHGNGGIRSLMTALDNPLKSIDRELARQNTYTVIWDIAPNLDTLSDNWDSFCIRWRHYYGYWACLPFFPDFQEADRLIAHIGPFFDPQDLSETSFRGLNCLENFKQIKRLIDGCDAYYIR